MKRLIRIGIIFSSIVLMAALSGCAPQVLTPSPGDIQTALAQTLTAEPSPTLPPTPRPIWCDSPAIFASCPTSCPPSAGFRIVATALD